MNVKDVASRYNVLIVNDFLPPREFVGPDPRYGCDPSSSRVFCSAMAKPEDHPEFLLHEIMHCVVQPPGFKITEVPEEIILLQFEQAVAKELEPWILPRVRQYRESTSIDMKDEDGEWCWYFGDLKRPYDQWFWKQGLRLCQRLDLLDACFRPTWRRPSWKNLTSSEIQRGFKW